ncbi:acyl carrier protein [Micromonospora sp. NBC_01813]|uniref:acyl carrier protein n=1 Tax=Micromonospora sp. NBC_01813 TaxID=2975988 RepID=UPI002DD8266A|nr:acyl carrier protein [Micromonospora sp. NBC_01813]WSA10801.1 acyl carrier protein [Micromonospora sp. NBC_01813]
MTAEQIRELVRDFALALNPDDPLPHLEEEYTFDEIGVDSMSFVDLLFSLERDHGIEIPDDDLPGITTVGDLVTYVTAR